MNDYQLYRNDVYLYQLISDKTEPATSAVQKDSESAENKNQDDVVTVEPEAEKMDTSEVVTDKVAEIATNTAERVMDSEKDKGKPTESAEKLRSDQKATAGMPKINLIEYFISRQLAIIKIIIYSFHLKYSNDLTNPIWQCFRIIYILI